MERQAMRLEGWTPLLLLAVAVIVAVTIILIRAVRRARKGH
jgi:hypothetical protein